MRHRTGAGSCEPNWGTKGDHVERGLFPGARPHVASLWPMPGPRCERDWPPCRPPVVTTYGHSQSHTDAARRLSRRLTAPTQRVRGPTHDGGLDSPACARCGLSPFGGRAIVLNSQSAERRGFWGVAEVGDSPLSLTWRRVDPVELFGTAAVVTPRCHDHEMRCRRTNHPGAAR